MSNVIESIFLSLYRLYISNKRYSKIFFILMSYIKPSLNKLSKSKFVVEFFGISNDNVTAVFVSHYIARKLEYRFTIKELFKPIGKDLRNIMTNNSILFGYKIKFIGRLTRRDRVRYSVSSSGNMPLSTMHAQIEHAFSLGYLKNGVCSLRV